MWLIVYAKLQNFRTKYRLKISNIVHIQASRQERWRKIPPTQDTARVVKLVDTRDLKSLAFRKGRTGSIPVSGTKSHNMEFNFILRY